jgi:predicted site-specific integrase-resolvase
VGVDPTSPETPQDEPCGANALWVQLHVALLESQGRRVEVAFPDEIEDDLIADFVAVITSMCARIYGKRGNRRRSERVRKCIEASEINDTGSQD